MGYHRYVFDVFWYLQREKGVLGKVPGISCPRTTVKFIFDRLGYLGACSGTLGLILEMLS